MKWSWKIGTLAGIAVYMHATFLLLLGWIALSHWMEYQSVLPTLLGVGFILALFLCVVLHEYGHALAARQCDFSILRYTREIPASDSVLRHLGRVAVPRDLYRPWCGASAIRGS
jgi:hypothetical protein